MKRDVAYSANIPIWTNNDSVHRFEVVSQEFDEIKFSETQPLTFQSIPWPLLSSPNTFTFDDIEWGNSFQNKSMITYSFLMGATYFLSGEILQRVYHQVVPYPPFLSAQASYRA